MSEHSNQQVEKWVLGALMDAEGGVLRSRASELLAASGLSAEDFVDPARSAGFGAIRALAERGRPADAQSVFAITRGLPALEAVTFESLLALQCGNSVNRESFLAHGEELRRLTLLRRLEAFYASQLKAIKAARPDPAAMAQSLEVFAQSFAASSQADETGNVDLRELAEEWDAAINGARAPHMATGIEVLDEAIDGFVPNLNVIGGMPSMGKSALIGEIIMACLERGMRVGLFGLEDATKWLPKRQLARAIGVPVGQVGSARLVPEQQEMLQEAAGRMDNLFRNLWVYRRAGITPTELVQRCKSWVLNRGVQAIFVDHGGEVQHETGGRKERFDLAVAATYRALRDLAVNHRVPVVVLCHFNRDTEKDQGGVPTMQSFAETEYIARMARLALGLWSKPGDPRLRCTVLKRTEGERDITVAIERDERCALVKRRGGELLNIREEVQAEREARKQAKEEKLGGLWPR